MYDFDVAVVSDKFTDKNGKTTYNVTTHIFLRAMKYPEFTIRVVVFHERAARIGKNAGLYEKFDLELAMIDGLRLYIPKPANKFPETVAQSKYIDCNKTAADNFFKMYPPDRSSAANAFREKARQVLAGAKQVLDKLSVRFWLSSGTLLGWYRECDIIPHSVDIDLEMWAKDYNPQIIPDMKKAGFQFKQQLGRLNDSLEVSFIAWGIKLDIFFVYEAPDHLWLGGMDVSNGEKQKYVFPKYDLCWTTLQDLFLRVPCPPLIYIEANYGSNWFTPKKKWNWKSSASNVRKNGYWPKDQWGSVVKVYS
ncbi:fukutin-like [Pecten maximus]|uniref:fukutin-like n=1 Tax=Pecten maximus TaxID=6579 RepID=UPI0014583C23|nr:fukutin-like [Pecten maximus]